MQTLIAAAQATNNADAKMFLSATLVRQRIVKARYFRQDAVGKQVIMQQLVNELAYINGMQAHVVSKHYVLNNLKALCGATWAHAVLALASPNIYINLNNKAAVLHMPSEMGSVQVTTQAQLESDWAVCFKTIFTQANSFTVEAIECIGNAVVGNIALSNAFNAADTGFTVPVYDEDAVAQAATLAAPPAEITIDPELLVQAAQTMEEDADA